LKEQEGRVRKREKLEKEGRVAIQHFKMFIIIKIFSKCIRPLYTEEIFSAAVCKAALSQLESEVTKWQTPTQEIKEKVTQNCSQLSSRISRLVDAPSKKKDSVLTVAGKY
jgi:predicted Fe-S protein YdhL (DUF1289 family)